MRRRPRQESAHPDHEGVERLGALLDHLGRLLAEEYVAILKSPAPVANDAEEA